MAVWQLDRRFHCEERLATVNNSTQTPEFGTSVAQEVVCVSLRAPSS